MTPARARGAAARRHGVVPWLFAAPALLLHVAVIGVPACFTVVLSFCTWNGIGPLRFAGLANYQAMLDDSTFGTALLNNLRWMALYLTVPTSMALGAALLIDALRLPAARLVFRSIVFLPATVAGVVVARIWAWLYHPFFGINLTLHGWGLDRLALNWLADPAIALYSVVLADNWRWWGFLVVIFVVALGQIDPLLYESARIDGANRFQIAWFITIPTIRPVLMFVVLTSIVVSFLVLEMIYLMTSGGPGTSTQVAGFWIYTQAIYDLSYGYAGALAVTTMVILGALVTAVIAVPRRFARG